MEPNLVNGLVDLVIGGYGITLLAGGIVGFKKANSRISLISSILFFFLFLSIMILSWLTPFFAYTCAICASGGLIVFFCIRFVQTKKPHSTLPGIIGGIVVIICCIIALVFGSHDNYWKPSDVEYTAPDSDEYSYLFVF